MKRYFLSLVAVSFLLPVLALADTLELKNGSVIRGTFIGGSAAQLSFRVGSTVQHYAVADVAAVKFDSDSAYGNSGYTPRSDQNYPPQSNYPSSGQQQNYPDSGSQQNYPSSGSQSNYPDSGSRPNYPNSAPQSNYPSSGQQQNYPDSAPQSNYPSAGQQQEYPNSSPEPPPAAPLAPTSSGDRITVGTGTRLTVRTIDPVDSDRNRVGDKFAATLDQPVYVNDTQVLPRGTQVYGRLEEAKEAGHLAGRAQLRLSLTGIVVNGQTYGISTGDYELSGKSRSANTAKKVGGGAVVGAIIGGVVGGGRGAAVGAGVGAGAGTAVQIATKGDQVHVPSETLLEFALDQPVTLPFAQSRQ